MADDADVKDKPVDTPVAPDPAPPPEAKSPVPMPGVNIQDLVSQATAPPDPELMSKLRGYMGEKVEAESRIGDEVIGRGRRDMQEAERLRKQAGAASNDVKPWNAEQEAKKHTTDPLEAFGSIGSVFAIMASAFTHQPMVNALNGSAAAITAIRERDDIGYKRAYDAWRSNTDLAVKRHQMMHQDYEAALQAMSKNMELGQVQMRIVANKYHDKQVLAFLDAGYADKETQDVINARNESAMKILGMSDKLDQWHYNNMLWQGDPEAQSGDPKLMQLAHRRIMDKTWTPEKDAYFTGKAYKEKELGRQLNSDELTKLYNETHPKYGASMYSQGARIESRATELFDTGQFATIGEARVAAERELATAKRKEDTSYGARVELRAQELFGTGKFATRGEAMVAAERELATAKRKQDVSEGAKEEEISRQLEDDPNSGTTGDRAASILKARKMMKDAGRKEDVSPNAEIARRAKEMEADQSSPTYGKKKESWDAASLEVHQTIQASRNGMQAEIARRAKAYAADQNSSTKGDSVASFDRAAEEVRMAMAPPNTQTEMMRRTKQYENDPDSATKGDHKASFHRAAQEVKLDQVTLSGNRADMLRGLAQRADESKKVITDLEKTLATHGAVVGVGGIIARPTETIENILKLSNETVRHDVQRKLELLRLWAPRMLTESSTRPLAAEEGRIKQIIPGLEPGASSQSVISAMRDLKKLLNTLEKQWLERSGGGFTAPSTEPPPGERGSWDDFPTIAPAPTPGRQGSLDAPPMEGARKAPDGNWYVTDKDRPGKYQQVMTG